MSPTEFAYVMMAIRRTIVLDNVTHALPIHMVHTEHVPVMMGIRKTTPVANVKPVLPTLMGFTVVVRAIQDTRRITRQVNVTNLNVQQTHMKRTDRAPVMMATKKTTLTANANRALQIQHGHMGHAPVIRAIRKTTTLGSVRNYNARLIRMNHMETAHVTMVTK